MGSIWTALERVYLSVKEDGLLINGIYIGPLAISARNSKLIDERLVVRPYDIPSLTAPEINIPFPRIMT